MSQPSARFIKLILEQADIFIKVYGGKEGFEKFREISAADSRRERWSDEQWQALLRDYLQKLEDKVPYTELCSKILIKAYVEYEREGSTPEFLKKWMLDSLSSISKGMQPEKALGLSSGRGQKKTKLLHNRFMCVCYYELQIRNGLTTSAAVKACEEHFKISGRAVYAFLKDLKISADISIKTLTFFSQNDISHLH